MAAFALLTRAFQTRTASAALSPAKQLSLFMTFDSGLQKIGFNVKTETEVTDVVKLNKQLVTLLSSIKSVGTFQQQVSALFSKYSAVQDALAKDLGVPSGVVVI
jgi:hypothetical protein